LRAEVVLLKSSIVLPFAESITPQAAWRSEQTAVGWPPCLRGDL
jgi:hypothetical protein